MLQKSSFTWSHIALFRPIRLFTCLILVFFAANLTAIDLQAFEAGGLLQSIGSKTFKHWNREKKKITGHTVVAYKFDNISQMTIETTKNLDKNKTVFSEKTLSFSSSGTLVRYEEIELKSGLKTVNTYDDKRIKTEVWQNDKKTKFNIASHPDLVPFEVITLFLRKQIPKLKKKKSLEFTLYLPFIAVELNQKGLPTSLSALDVKATIVKTEKMGTILGEKEVLTIEIKPTSFFVNALLPEDKSVFVFTFFNQTPYDLLMFEEGKTQVILSELEG